MSVAILPLFEPTSIGTSPTWLFTATVPTRIDKLTFSNPLATAGQVTVFLVPQGGVPNQGTMVQPPWNVGAGVSWDAESVMGHVLDAGDQLFALATAAGQLVVFCSGATTS